MYLNQGSSLEDRMDFRQVLAESNYYMPKWKCRYAIAINEVEYTVIYHVPRYNGWLNLSESFPIAWTDNLRGDGEVMTADVACTSQPNLNFTAYDRNFPQAVEYPVFRNQNAYLPANQYSLRRTMKSHRDGMWSFCRE
jgi:hypothetical protein